MSEVISRPLQRELFLVCSVLGSKVEETDPSTGEIFERFIPVEDAASWLQDLQRAIKRDDDQTRPISLLLSSWNVLPTTLIPLVLSQPDDESIVRTMAKVFVILTKPLTEVARKAARFNVDTKSQKATEETIERQREVRDNALAQNAVLEKYKHLLLTRKGVLGVFVSLLSGPLSRKGSARTEMDAHTIELILHLFRNLLAIGPVSPHSCNSTEYMEGQQRLITTFGDEMVLDLVVVLGQMIEKRENSQWNLVLMEILFYLVKDQDPVAIAESSQPGMTTANNKSNSASRSSNIVTPPTKSSLSLKKTSSLLSGRNNANISSRHSRFSGTVVKQKAGGASVFINDISKGKETHPEVARKKNRKTNVFVAKSTTSAASSKRNHTSSTKLCNKVLDDFCSRFVDRCYGPLMKSLKNEFRRESSRLQENDKVIYFQIISFFSCWWRRKIEMGENTNMTSSADHSTAPATMIGELMFTLDIFSFNIVLQSFDTFIATKKPYDLAVAVDLYKNMMKLLSFMNCAPKKGNSDSEADSTEAAIALGLMDRLFYQSEPLDRLTKLFQYWKQGVFTKKYLCDLVEIASLTMKMLDRNSKQSPHSSSSGEKGRNNVGRVEKMREVAQSFDVEHYFIKLVSNNVIRMYGQLLREYKNNDPATNRQIASFFFRVCKVVVKPKSVEEGDGGAEETITLEPMLYNIDLMIVFDKILNDTTIRNNTQMKEVILLAKTIVRHFAVSAENNPLLYVETLFGINQRQKKFCEMVKQVYFDTDLIGGGSMLSTTADDGDILVPEVFYTGGKKKKKSLGARKTSLRMDGFIASESEDGSDDDFSVGSVDAKKSSDKADLDVDSGASSSEDEVEVDDYGSGDDAPAVLKVTKKKKREKEKKKKKKPVLTEVHDERMKQMFKQSESISVALAKCVEIFGPEGFDRKTLKHRAKELNLKSNKLLKVSKKVLESGNPYASRKRDLGFIESVANEAENDNGNGNGKEKPVISKVGEKRKVADDFWGEGGEDDKWNEDRTYSFKTMAAKSSSGKKLKKISQSQSVDDDDDDDDDFISAPKARNNINLLLGEEDDEE